jgi:predicted NUDIX family phosphoesterase
LASLCGLLWDDDSPVSLVHLGLVFWVEARAAEVSVRETEKLAGRWLSRPELERLRRRLEPWARLTLDTLPRLEARARGLGTLRVHMPGAVEAAPLQLA